MGINWKELSALAWKIRDNALIVPGGKTKVGCAVIAYDDVMASGCNLQHKYRIDIHAEKAAIGALRTKTTKNLMGILTVAERDKFTPCGDCMDWILELGGPDCFVVFQSKPDGEFEFLKAGELMPHYPR
jgi:cytidine deaminase